MGTGQLAQAYDTMMTPDNVETDNLLMRGYGSTGGLMKGVCPFRSRLLRVTAFDWQDHVFTP